MMPDKNPIEYWIFDLDNTLYPSKNSLFSQVDRRMGEYIALRFDLPFEEARALQKKYFQTYGTTLRGLMIEHAIIPNDFLEFVHDINFDVLEENISLNKAIRNLEGTKVIYTNATQEYAHIVLEKIGLKGVFTAIFDIKSADFMPKPDPLSYLKMVQEMKLDPKKSIMVEDMARNLAPASEMGMRTAWVTTGEKWSAEGRQDKYINYTVSNLAEWLETMGK